MVTMPSDLLYPLIVALVIGICSTIFLVFRWMLNRVLANYADEQSKLSKAVDSLAKSISDLKDVVLERLTKLETEHEMMKNKCNNRS